MGHENLIRERYTLGMEVSGFPYQGIYEVSTVQRYGLGARYYEPHTGRTFKYAMCGSGTLITPRGAKSFLGLAYEGTPAATYAIGDTAIQMNEGTYPATANTFTLNELQGGHWYSWTTLNQPRWIIGNDASDANGETVVYLDAGLENIITADSSACEMHYNPYSSVFNSEADSYASVIGLPMCSVPVNNYCWLQTWGPRWVTPNAAGYGGSACERQMVFDDHGSIMLHSASVSSNSYQHAGFVLDGRLGSSTGYDSNFIMIQISP